MSNPITGARFAVRFLLPSAFISASSPSPSVSVSSSKVVSAYPTTPPAGPERIALYPLNLEAGVNPPSDCINETATSPSPSSNPERNKSRYSFVFGVKYASTLAVCPRGTARTIGTSWLDNETCSNPNSVASSPISFSWSGNTYECSRTTANDLTPSRNSARSFGRKASRSRLFSTKIDSPVVVCFVTRESPAKYAPPSTSGGNTRTRSSTSTVCS
mmetsp:Transcript_5617/g.18553  ORF Transcript_5617/g.18553 Transcript_5617/m.18553 type:complete len:216 (+) Transcript_5617:1531-2178(+)